MIGRPASSDVGQHSGMLEDWVTDLILDSATWAMVALSVCHVESSFSVPDD